MSNVEVALLGGLAFAAWAIAVLLLAYLAARVSRYRRYRRLWPHADRGRVWHLVR